MCGTAQRFFVVAVGSVAAVLYDVAPVPFDTRVHSQSSIVWFADHEEPGDFDWYAPGGGGLGGGQFNSGCNSASGAGMAGTSFVKWTDINAPPPANGGDFGLMLASATTCGGPGFSAGTRMFRWKESKWDYPNQALYYKVWFYFPQNYRLTGSADWWFFNLFQWKSKYDTTNDVFFSVNIYNRPDG